MKNPQKIAVVDLEMICDEPENTLDTREIIQFGYCLVDKSTLEISEKTLLFIKPKINLKEVPQYTYDFLNITPSNLKSGVPWRDACSNIINKRGLRQYMWTAWGQDDDAIKNECSIKKCEYPLSDSFFDLSELYNFFYDTRKSPSLKNGLEYFNLEFIGKPHKADDDALNTARILVEIIKTNRGLRRF